MVQNYDEVNDMEDKAFHIKETAFEVQTKARKIEQEAKSR